jgi:hypothetical protein
MSPPTRSCFTCWALFDAWVRPTRRSAPILEIGTSFGMHTELLRLIQCCKIRAWGSTSTAAERAN